MPRHRAGPSRPTTAAWLTTTPPTHRAACHAVHETDGDPFAYFVSRLRVDRRCAPWNDLENLPDIPSLVSKPRG